jgi:glucose-1-phosphatase
VCDGRVLLFDPDGVLVESSGRVALKQLLPHLQEDELILARRLDSNALEVFECGKIQPEAFARMFIDEWDIQLKPFDFLTVFACWVRGSYPGPKTLIQSLRMRHTFACLRNANATHWAQLVEVQNTLEVCIISHLTGYMKPDAAACGNALPQLEVSAGSVYFLPSISQTLTPPAKSASAGSICAAYRNPRRHSALAFLPMRALNLIQL